MELFVQIGLSMKSLGWGYEVPLRPLYTHLTKLSEVLDQRLLGYVLGLTRNSLDQLWSFSAVAFSPGQGKGVHGAICVGRILYGDRIALRGFLIA